MKTGIVKFIFLTLAVAAVQSEVCAESLFRTGVSQNVYSSQPRSLFGSTKARTIGDLVIVQIEEQYTSSDKVTLNIARESSTTDKFSSLLNKVLPGKLIPKEVSGFGGSLENDNQSSISRTTKISNTIAAQVIQIMPNGNLVIQGKKTAINGPDKVNLILSGIVDPRMITSSGSVSSKYIANLQMAVISKGTISRSETVSPVNMILRHLF